MSPPETAAPADATALAGATVLVTGCAGFIGFAVARNLLSRGVRVVGLDDMSALYYPVELKRMRLAALRDLDGFSFAEIDLCDASAMAELFRRERPTHVVHLAAHAAVMPSFEDPVAYMRANVIGTQTLLEEARRCERLSHLVYASTSSVYGRAREETPFTETQKTDTPISVYGASKVANEAMMQAHADRYGFPVTGLRFFKVYGPWGRPDTVFFKFVERVYWGLPINLHNYGRIVHAFTYIDDIVEGVLAALVRPRQSQPATPHPVYNLGNPRSQELGHCLDLIEAALGRKADRRLVELPPGDRSFSIADISRAERELGYVVRVPVEVGIPRLVDWYLGSCAPLQRVFSGGAETATPRTPACQP